MRSKDVERVFNKGLSLKYPEALEGLENCPSAEIVLQRNECLRAVADAKGALDWLSRIDLLLNYAGALLQLLQDSSGSAVSSLATDLVITLLNASGYYQEISLDTMERAYGTAMATSMWSTSGLYLRKGLGLLQFTLAPPISDITSCLSQTLKLRISSTINEMIMEFQFLQQIGIVVLSLSKLRSRVHKERKDAMLDIQEGDLNDLSRNSLVYAKLVIGCLETSSRYSNDCGNIINKSGMAYLNSLIFLLLSLDQYSKDECGVSVGMIDMSISYLQKLVPKSQLEASLLLEKRKKRDILKSAFQKNEIKNKTIRTSLDIWSKKSKNNQLLPLLKLTLDDFLIQLAILLRYRYVQTNEKLSFKPIVSDESTLRKLFPRSVASELQGSEWVFDRETRSLQEVSTTPYTETNANDYY